MKAVEYLNRYGDRIINDDVKAIENMFNVMISEFNSTAHRRHILKNDTVNIEKLINELNRKGERIAEMFELKYGKPILKRDWFKNLAEIAYKHGDNR